VVVSTTQPDSAFSASALPADRAFDITAIPGHHELLIETRGDPDICVAILDGPVDLSHPSLVGANLSSLETVVPAIADGGPASQHGTHVASVIFGQHDGPVKGIAPACRGLIVPIFRDADADSFAPCSQIDLARAISQAIQAGAQIINISGGQFTPSGAAYPLLADVVQKCASQGVLIVAAAGNQGCECLHLPAALPAVLAVGAMNSQGDPMEFSNWGAAYQVQGVLAPGEHIVGATPSGGTVSHSGTSYATPIASGVVALLLSLQIKRGEKPDPQSVREAILQSALGCEHQQVSDCRRLLAGRLHIPGAVSLITQGANTMSEQTELQQTAESSATASGEINPAGPQTPQAVVEAASSDGNGYEPSTDAPLTPAPVARTVPAPVSEDPLQPSTATTSRVAPSACTCGAAGPPQMVFALGQLSYDFGTEARRDSILQHMDGPHANPHDPGQLLKYLDDNPWEAASILWTLNFDQTSIYAIVAQGSFASEVGKRLCQFLGETAKGEVERVSIPGVIAGKALLLNGQVVPVIVPELRGVYSWTTSALLEAVCGKAPAGNAARATKEAYAKKAHGVRGFLDRVYYELRNLGVTPQERAINYVATNALQVEQIYESALKEEMELDGIDVERSPICRPDSDCWDVKLLFFTPKDPLRTSRRVHRFTVDVSDVVPVMVGEVRSWFVR
jgi:cyanobactin maturation PatA/PatG family protease